MTPPDYASFTTEELAAEFEALKDEQRGHRRAIDRIAAEVVLVEALLMQRLGDGEAVVSPYSGRVCFKGEGTAGAAQVNRDALDEMANDLPAELWPRSELKYPGVTAIRQALKDRRITRDVHDHLLIEGEPVSVIRWRTIDGVAA